MYLQISKNTSQRQLEHEYNLSCMISKTETMTYSAFFHLALYSPLHSILPGGTADRCCKRQSGFYQYLCPASIISIALTTPLIVALLTVHILFTYHQTCAQHITGTPQGKKTGAQPPHHCPLLIALFNPHPQFHCG